MEYVHEDLTGLEPTIFGSGGSCDSLPYIHHATYVGFCTYSYLKISIPTYVWFCSM
jgi:hypothetical protein